MTDKGRDTDGSEKPSGWKQTLHALEGATVFTPAGLFDKFYGSQVRLGLRDFFSQTAGSVVSLFDGEAGERVADRVSGALGKVTEYKDGQFDFRLAKGWKMPEGLKYNGKHPSDPAYQGPKVGQELDGFFSIFLRDKVGNLEVLDKDDRRFAQIVGPYAFTQMTLMATVGTKGLTSLKSGLAAAEGLSGKLATTAYLGAASADAWGGGKTLYQTFNHSLVLRPEAVDRFAHLIDNPEAMTLQQLRSDLNLVLDQYSRRSGGKVEQYYIPPLKSDKGVVDLLDQMSKGQVQGFERANPFAEIPALAKKEDIHIGNIRDIANNLHFQKSFLKLASKALDGEHLNSSEHLALRFGMNILFAQKNLTLMGQGKDQAVYSENDYAKTLGVLRGELSEPLLRMKVRGTLEEDKSLSIEQVDRRLDIAINAWDMGGRRTVLPDKDLKESVQEKLTHVSAEIAKKERGVNPIVQNRLDSPFGFN